MRDPSTLNPQPSTFPRGISLLEVLIAIFVTAIGLLGVAALIPVGTFQVGEANKNIRAHDIAQAAYREIQVRDMLNPNNWVDGSGFAAPTPGEAFVIDPFYFARNGSVVTPVTSPEYWFPYVSNDDVNKIPPPNRSQTLYQVGRLSLRAWENGPAMFAEPFTDANQNGVWDSGENYADRFPNGRWDDRSLVAERIFSGHDDLTFTAPGDPQLRPFPLNMIETYTDSDGNGQWDLGEPFADLNGNGVWDNQSLVQPSAGDYSWLITAAPNTPWLTGVRSYLVSIVVFYKRQVNYARLAETPGERTVFADLLDGAADGGRSAFLYYQPSAGSDTKYLNIRAGNWLMLGTRLHGFTNLSGDSQLIRWARIVSVGELLTVPADFPTNDLQTSLPGAGWHGRLVTLAGPDMDSRPPLANTAGVTWTSNNSVFRDMNTATSELTVHATLFEGVVNVFERTMELD